VLATLEGWQAFVKPKRSSSSARAVPTVGASRDRFSFPRRDFSSSASKRSTARSTTTDKSRLGLAWLMRSRQRSSFPQSASLAVNSTLNLFSASGSIDASGRILEGVSGRGKREARYFMTSRLFF
jgi:hypothetical protein